MKKTIFITGASSGLGKATAKLFQSNGWNVIATMRNPEKELELSQLENVTLLSLDITNLEQIDATVHKAIQLNPVDVVFNNAGYGLMGALEATTDEQILTQINTNLLGAIRVTKAFIPHFREKKNGLFINTTSMGGFLTFPLSSLYHATKFALEGWAEGMSYELSQHNIKIKTIAPGGIATDFTGRSLQSIRSQEYEILEQKLFTLTEQMKDASSPEEIASIVFEAATDNKDQIRYIAGEDANMLFSRRQEIGSENFRKELASQF